MHVGTLTLASELYFLELQHARERIMLARKLIMSLAFAFGLVALAGEARCWGHDGPQNCSGDRD